MAVEIPGRPQVVNRTVFLDEACRKAQIKKITFCALSVICLVGSIAAALALPAPYNFVALPLLAGALKFAAIAFEAGSTESEIQRLKERLPRLKPALHDIVRNYVNSNFATIDMSHNNSAREDIQPLLRTLLKYAGPNLTSLDLSHTRIRDLPEIGYDATDRLTGLRNMNISNTQIKEIPYYYILLRLESLDISHTEIKKLPALFNSALPTLRTLRISGNITELALRCADASHLRPTYQVVHV
jgi:Leucine-rich repeat (LRR) protein